MEERNVLTESQYGLRKKRGMRDNIFILNSLIENKLKNKGGKLYVLFLYLKAAFDSIKKMMGKLNKYKIAGRTYT